MRGRWRECTSSLRKSILHLWCQPQQIRHPLQSPDQSVMGMLVEQEGIHSPLPKIDHGDEGSSIIRMDEGGIAMVLAMPSIV
jgi:hypothetical protein